MNISRSLKKQRKPAFQPSDSDRTTVLAMSGAGFAQEAIASCLGPSGIDEKTMRKHFKRELAIGKTRVDGICVMGLVKLMQEGNLGALIWWSKARLGWRETVAAQFTGANDGPIEIKAGGAREMLEARIAGIRSRLFPDEDPKVQ